MREIFESACQTVGSLAGVFEYDGETGYFYIYDTKWPENRKIIGTILVIASDPDFCDTDVAIEWNSNDQRVGLFLKGQLWAGFDIKTGEKFGGDYRAGAAPSISAEFLNGFQNH